MNYNVYVTISGEDRIARYEMDSVSGSLAPRDDVPLPGEPGPMAISPDKRFMYVAQRGSRHLTSFRINPADGGLTKLGTIPLESDPCYMTTDRTGGFLLSAHYMAETAAVHRIADDGAVAHPPIEWRHTGQGAHCFQTDRSNRHAFVAHVAARRSVNAIFQFRFDAESGQLTPNEPARFSAPSMMGPRHFCFHPAKDFFYEQGSSVTVCALDTARGTLTHLQTVPTLPEDWSGDSRCSQIQITPCGRFLYAPNRGHDSIAEFSVDQDSGILKALGHTPAEASPRALALDPKGRFLLSASFLSGHLSVYRVDSKTGRLAGGLDQTSRYKVGDKPMWVSILRSA
ncbi:MAG: lactonase family protein [Proteobacteria bacterium]|nr:lactonase family protein [Pseudomonadota bacterium]